MNGSHNTIKGMQIYENGGWGQSQDWRLYGGDNPDPERGAPSSPGVCLAGSHMTIEYSTIYNCGEDSIQVASRSECDHVRINRCWLFNSRPHSKAVHKSFNNEDHTDAIQYWWGPEDGKPFVGFILENSIIGPGCPILMGSSGGGEFARCNIDDALFYNTLFVDMAKPSGTGHTCSGPTDSKNWTWDKCTFAGSGAGIYSIRHYGENPVIKNTVISGFGDVALCHKPTITNSYYYDIKPVSRNGMFTPDATNSRGLAQNGAVEADPMYKKPVFANAIGMQGWDGFDFTLTNPAIPEGVGCTVRSAKEFFDCKF
jgi:hypothetical protein